MVTETKPTMHLGRKISRIRELRGMKQETLAAEMNVSQQAISKLEQSENIEDDKLEAVAKVLGVTKDNIKNFNEEAAICNIQNNSDTSSNNSIINYQFNPIEKIIELYERMLKIEREKNELLERLLQEKS